MKIKIKTIYKIISAILLGAVLVTIFLLSNENSTQSNETSGFLITLLTELFGKAPSQNVIRTLAHFSEYAVLGFLVLNCIYAFTDKKRFFLSVGLSELYALSDEIHQLFVPGRAFQITDLLVDLCGIILGCAVIFIIIKAQRGRWTGGRGERKEERGKSCFARASEQVDR